MSHHTQTRRSHDALLRATRLFRSLVERVAFWVAVVAPLAYPLLLFADGVPHAPLLAGLVLANVACLVLGHGHARDERVRDASPALRS